ncbi:M50 family metallopeptidase [Telmatocola sphagniphila]|uniref:M50 family metallopeptidase n=2 Tax=Telmatocola sphagniphila TaxID=1123043 RepID=A0A8E6BCX7_9BACT|nr:M50 family metallopeptidase [Telmatocola sphagniphila]
MQAVHETGHVIGALLSGGKVERVVLYPLTISRTDLSENPHPLFVVWAGPIFGVIVPLLLWAFVVCIRGTAAFVFRYFAGFCLVVNGIYISCGSFDRVGDCGQMLLHGSSIWELWFFGLLTVPVGLTLWHKQGVHFGLGASKEAVRRDVAWGTLAVFVLLVVLGFLVGE